jgi:hypothetical protein
VNVYAFDVDHTLEVSDGPVTLESLADLRRAGNIVGLCGNWAVVTRGVPDWHLNISFIGPLNLTKAAFLDQIVSNVPADEYIVVGNDPDHFGASPDKHTAASAGWRFIREDEFAAGAR